MYRGIFSLENKDTGVMYEICFKLIMRTLSSVLIIDFEQTSDIFLVTLLLTVYNFCLAGICVTVCWIVFIILTFYRW